MLEHISLPVTDYKKAKRFYTAALKPLRYTVRYDFPNDATGFKEGGHTSFWIVKRPHTEKIHIAFLAKNRKMVRDFYAAALKAGGRDNGAPGVLKEYSPDYYAAYMFDPDGNNIEAVCYV